MSEPTPRPWYYQENTDEYTHIIRAGENQFLFSMGQESSGQARADARHVVHAVNCHEDLVAALQDLLHAPDRSAWIGAVANAESALVRATAPH